MVFIQALGSYIIAFIVLFAISIFFMQGAFISLLPFVAIPLSIVIHKALFKVRYLDED